MECAGGTPFVRARAWSAIALAALVLALPAAADAALAPAPIQLVRVSTPDEKSEAVLDGLGLDLTEHAREGFRDVVLHGAGDAAALRRAGLTYAIRVADLAAYSARRAQADREFARSHQTTALPSGNNTYRRLPDYNRELRKLADENPKLVRHFTLPERTYEGRAVHGIEIAPPEARRRGRPAFLMLGLHHAREWPSGEHTIEWAYEVINGWNERHKRARKLLRRARVIVVPVVNPDGFNTSREFGELEGGGGGRGGDDLTETVNIVTHLNEYRRKNCRLIFGPEAGTCLQPSLGLVEIGVDPNRNYGGLWGGPGASTDPPAQDYRGPAPFSEPETRNIQHLVSRDQVTMLITNHTFSNLVLRPPGLASLGDPPDAKQLKRVGDTMAAENGYESQPGYQLYDTTGTTEDWSYNATGGFGYTFEIGPTNFHPPFADVIAEWEGTTEAAGNGGGNRAAFYEAWRWAGVPASHSILRGRAPRRVKRVELTKTFMTKTSPVIGGADDGEVLEFKDELRTIYSVRKGRFVIHANPSTRPIVEGSAGRKPTGPPSDPVEFSGGAETAAACADFDTEDPACFNDHPFRVPRSKKFDNETATIRMEWPSPVSDWDLKVFRDSDGDGSSEGETKTLGSSGNSASTFEQTTISGLGRGGRYVVRVINYAAAEPYTGRVDFAGPPPGKAARTEKWTLRCLGSRDRKLGSARLAIKRGRTKSVDLRRACG